MSLAGIQRYDRNRVHRSGGHALVVGSSVAGVLAARVLADAFERVTVVERDRLDDDARRGVPQAQHPHALLRAGQVVMEDLFPGFGDELVASGALVLGFGRDFRMHAAGEFMAPAPTEIPMYFASRPLVERILRARLERHERVTLWSACRVERFVAADGGRAVAGAHFRHQGAEGSVAADLVVDATGRATRSPEWLRQWGYPAPPTEKVHVDLAYRTCQIRRPPDDHRGALIMPSPDLPRGGFLVPIERDRWLVTLSGMRGDHPPDDLDGLRAFAATLPHPMVSEVLQTHEPATPEVRHYRFTANTRHRFDRLRRLPPGLVCIGDAIASFNPIYGQGMSVAALQALTLHHALAVRDGQESLPKRFYARVGKIAEGAWNMAAGGDFQFPRTRGVKPAGADVLNRYITRLHRKAHEDEALSEAFYRVAGMELPPSRLLRPDVAWRVLRPGASARRPSARDP